MATRYFEDKVICLLEGLQSGTSTSGTWDQLTAPGSTSSVQLANNEGNIMVQYKVQNINTNVVVRLEGSLDNTNWFNLGSGDTTITGNGTYAISYVGASVEYTRFTFVSESGGTNATIDAKYKLTE